MPKSTLTVPGMYQNLKLIGDFVKDWAIITGLNERESYAVEMAVDEACSNIIQYAYGGESKGKIKLRCQKLNNGLKVIITDQGAPFDPTAIKPPDLQASLEERSEGGLGLFLMRQLMDDVTFRFESNKNTLVMIKKQGVS